jgi:hypothetical protein
MIASAPLLLGIMKKLPSDFGLYEPEAHDEIAEGKGLSAKAIRRFHWENGHIERGKLAPPPEHRLRDALGSGPTYVIRMRERAS